MAASSLLGKKKKGGIDPLALAMQEFSRIQAPTAEEMKIQLQQYVEAGVLTPEQAQTILMEDTAYNDIALDPGTREAQADALRQLSDISNQGGMTAIDRARMMEINDDMQTANRGAQQAITQNMAERGVSGSGAELAARLSGQQAASSNNARAGAEVAAEAQRRALEAIMAKGNLGGSMRGQDHQQAAAKAQARDAINQFNATNRQNVINSNVDRRTQANAANLGNKQNIMLMNTQAENENRLRDSDLKQRQFENQMNLARGKTGQLNQMSAAQEKEEDRDAAYRNALLGAGATMLGSK
jgi:hypothetical protein